MKKINNLLNCIMAAFVGVFVGHLISICKNIEFYKTRSISWYEDLYYWTILLFFELVLCLTIKYIIRKSNKGFKEDDKH